MVEEAIKTLDTQAACQEQLGNIDQAVILAVDIVKYYKTSPVVMKREIVLYNYDFRDI